MMVTPVVFDDYIEENRLKAGINKIRYDIIYMQNLKYSSTENYQMEFKSSTGSVEVSGDKSGIEFDYVCFNDKNDDGKPDYDEDQEKNEILKDPMTKQYMMYDFDSAEYTKKEFKMIILEKVELYDKTDNQVRTAFWFDKLGELKVKNNTGIWDELEYFGENDIEHNYIELTKGNRSIKLILYPLSNDMKIEIN